MNLIPEDGLPPILISTGVKGGEGIIWQPAFMLTRCNNLVAGVFILKIRCWQCAEYWKEFSVSTRGRMLGHSFAQLVPICIQEKPHLAVKFL